MTDDRLYLKQDEKKFMGMAVLNMLETMTDMSTDVTINWNPEARKSIKEMLDAGKSVKLKMEKLGFDMTPMPPYEDGDEKEFLTKES
jgi:hypothetical protein